MKKVLCITLAVVVLLCSTTFCFNPFVASALSVSELIDISSYVDSNFSSYDDSVKGQINVGLNTAVSSIIDITKGNKGLSETLVDNLLGSLNIDTSISTQTTLTFNFGATDDTYSVVVPDEGVVMFYHHSHGGGGGKNRVTSGDDLVTSGKVFSDYIDKVNSYYQPQEGLNYISWLTDPLTESTSNKYLSFFQDSDLFCGKGWSEVYLLGFMRVGSEYYYAQYLLHFSLTQTDDDMLYQWEAFSYDTLKHEFIIDTPYKSNSTIKSRIIYPYMDISCPDVALSTTYFKFYDGHTSWISQKHTASSQYSFTNYGTFLDSRRNEFNTYNNRFSNSTPDDTLDKDVGYFVSNEPIKMIAYADVDTTHIPDNYYVTLSGDTVYDYSISNTSGDTTTINNYITNNYTFPTSPSNSDDNTGGGSTNGNVTVGGSVDVNGQVDVNFSPLDINVNVNGGGSSSGNEDVSFDETLDIKEDNFFGILEGYFAPVKGFYEKFFDFLPSSFLYLILASITCALLCRLFGR